MTEAIQLPRVIGLVRRGDEVMVSTAAVVTVRTNSGCADIDRVTKVSPGRFPDGANPVTVAIVDNLQEARAVLRAREESDVCEAVAALRA